MGKSAKNFGSKAAYGRWLAYGHIHGDFARSPGNTPVKIKGKAKKVKHGKPSPKPANPDQDAIQDRIMKHYGR